ncbi:hypothetical protein ABK040_013294 [Willaertia magna]
MSFLLLHLDEGSLFSITQFLTWKEKKVFSFLCKETNELIKKFIKFNIVIKRKFFENLFLETNNCCFNDFQIKTVTFHSENFFYPKQVDNYFIALQHFLQMKNIDYKQIKTIKINEIIPETTQSQQTNDNNNNLQLLTNHPSFVYNLSNYNLNNNYNNNKNDNKIIYNLTNLILVNVQSYIPNIFLYENLNFQIKNLRIVITKYNDEIIESIKELIKRQTPYLESLNLHFTSSVNLTDKTFITVALFKFIMKFSKVKILKLNLEGLLSPYGFQVKVENNFIKKLYLLSSPFNDLNISSKSIKQFHLSYGLNSYGRNMIFDMPNVEMIDIRHELCHESFVDNQDDFLKILNAKKLKDFYIDRVLSQRFVYISLTGTRNNSNSKEEEINQIINNIKYNNINNVKNNNNNKKALLRNKVEKSTVNNRNEIDWFIPKVHLSNLIKLKRIDFIHSIGELNISGTTQGILKTFAFPYFVHELNILEKDVHSLFTILNQLVEGRVIFNWKELRRMSQLFYYNNPETIEGIINYNFIDENTKLEIDEKVFPGCFTFM